MILLKFLPKGYAVIRPVDNDNLKAFRILSNMPDPWACRIACLYESYSGYEGLAQFAVQEAESGLSAVLSKYGADFTVFALPSADRTEIENYIKMSGYGSVHGNITLFYEDTEGTVMKLTDRIKLFSDKPTVTDITLSYPDIKEIYRLMKECEDESFIVPRYEDIVVELSHRLRHGTALCCRADTDGKTVSFAMTAALSETAAVIGSVCTAPSYRRKGLAKGCICEIVRRLDGREIFIICAKKNIGYYQGIGFDKVSLTL